MSISKEPPFINLISITVKIWGKERPHIVTITARQVARTLAALIYKGEQGITALEMGAWAFRLGAYIHILRHEYGLDIQTQKEEHVRGWHARYVLITHVKILDILTE